MNAMDPRDVDRRGFRPFGSPYTLRESAQWLSCFAHPRLGEVGSLQRAPRRSPPSGKPSKRILFFGDLMAPPRARPPMVDESLRDLFATADLVVGNLEAPIGSDRAAANRFQISRRTLVATLERLGIAPDRCFLSIANNHIGDFGPDGVSRTTEALRQIGIGSIGGVDSQDRQSVRTFVGDLSIDLVAWTQWLNHPVPPSTGGIVTQSRALDWFRSPRRDRADLTVAFPHWGYEFMHTPRPEDRRLVGELAGQRVDLVVGHHPHVIQPAEVRGRSLCVYSLGGLVQGRAVALRWPVRLGAILALDAGPPEEAGTASVVGYELFAITHEHGRHENRLSLLDRATVRDRDRMRERFETIYPGP